MMNWVLAGTERKDNFEENLTPEELEYSLMRYQKVFGKEFGLKELLQLEDIKSKALIAEAINDAPEFFIDQIGRMRNSHEVGTISRSLEYIAENLSRVADEM